MDSIYTRRQWRPNKYHRINNLGVGFLIHYKMGKKTCTRRKTMQLGEHPIFHRRRRLIDFVESSWILRTLVFLGATLLLCATSLTFAFGSYVWDVYYGYFKNPMIFIFNWLPILLMQMVLLSACGRQWLAFLINSVLTFLPAIGNFYKLSFRNDPVCFFGYFFCYGGVGSCR